MLRRKKLADDDAREPSPGAPAIVPLAAGAAPFGPAAAAPTRPAPAAMPAAVSPSVSIGDIAARVTESVQVGLNRDGHREVRLDVTQGSLQGVEVRLAATPGGVEVKFLTETDAARRALEAPLVELTQALAERGVTVGSVEVAVRAEVGDRRGRRGGEWDEAPLAPVIGGRGLPGAAPLPRTTAGSGTDYVA
ncbi:MAG TPA: flagellar hook-length control protein FliK [Polyangia bacterium]|jgi:hypothetical protein